MKPDVILIADAGPGIGWGHAVRQLALANALVGKGVRTLFVTRTHEALTLDWPCLVWLVGDVARCELPSPWATVVYDLPDDAVNEGRYAAVRFGDYGPRASRDLDYVVCPNFAATAHEWDAPALLGPRFAPLREPFNDGWLPAQNRAGVFVYGDAPALPKGSPPSFTVPGFSARRSAHAMSMAAVALVPPSMVALECLAIGTPVVLYVPGPKWQPIADAMEAAGVARIWSGRADDHTIGCVLADDGLRRRMSEAGREAVDGRGADRLAEWLA